MHSSIIRLDEMVISHFRPWASFGPKISCRVTYKCYTEAEISVLSLGHNKIFIPVLVINNAGYNHAIPSIMEETLYVV